MSDPTTLAKAEQAFVSSLLAQTPDLTRTVAVAKRFNLLFRRKSERGLEAVLTDAANMPLAEFAASLRRDLAAVQGSLDLPWTTSPAESQINRLKTLKCSMYGRASFQLLRARVQPHRFRNNSTGDAGELNAVGTFGKCRLDAYTGRSGRGHRAHLPAETRLGKLTMPMLLRLTLWVGIAERSAHILT